MKSILKDIGLEAERVQMYHVSSAQAAQFAQAATDINNLIISLGPSPLRSPEPPQEPVDKPGE